MKRPILFLITVLIVGAAHAMNYESLPVRQHNKTKNCLNSCVTFIVDSQGNKFVVKQYKTRAKSKLLTTTLIELVALDIGHAVDIPLNKACLIPAGVPFIGKDSSLPATLHTYVPGSSFRGYAGEKYKSASILQNSKQGLTRSVIYHMSRHIDLSRMAALDTFVGNNDRGRHNFYYQPSTDSFIGIDMGSSFGRDLCKLATKNIIALLKDEDCNLTKQELEGLAVYYQTLKQLVTLFTPEIVCAHLDAYAQASRLFDPSMFSDKKQEIWSKQLAHYKKTTHCSYAHAKTLLSTLEQLFEKYEFIIRN